MLDGQRNFTPQRPVIVLGAAVGDVVLGVDSLPRSGDDVEAEARDRQIGGCAFNVARALARLQVPVVNGIPVGVGPWASQIEIACRELGLEPLLRHFDQDNGWCLALVEPCGERTFVSITGCEARWSAELLSTLPIPETALIYASGYELVGEQSQALRDWLIQRPADSTLLLDPGPRVTQLEKGFLGQLMRGHTVLTLNRDEVTQLCGEGDPVAQASRYAQQQRVILICRLDKAGAWLCEPQGTVTHLPIYPVTLVDSIGAGDAHCAGVLAGLSAGWSLAECVDLGNQVAAWVVSYQGAANTPEWPALQARFAYPSP